MYPPPEIFQRMQFQNYPLIIIKTYVFFALFPVFAGKHQIREKYENGLQNKFVRIKRCTIANRTIPIN